MGGEPGENTASLLRGEPGGDDRSRQGAPGGQLDEAPRVVGHESHRSQEILHHCIGRLDQGPENARVVAGVWTEAIGSGVNVSENDSRPPIAQWVGERDGRMDPLHLEAEVAEEGRGNSQGMYCRADVMGEPGQGQLLRPGPPSNFVGLLHDEDPSPAS